MTYWRSLVQTEFHFDVTCDCLQYGRKAAWDECPYSGMIMVVDSIFVKQNKKNNSKTKK